MARIIDRAAILPIEFQQGATWTRFLRLRLDNGLLLDTSYWYAALFVRAGDYDGPLVIDMQYGNGRTQTGLQGTAPNQYNVLLNLPVEATMLDNWIVLSGGVGVYTFQITDTFGNVYRYLQGPATLSRTAVY